MSVSGIDALTNIEAFNSKAKKLDPFGIFKNNIEAIGGTYKVNNDKNYSISGDITIDRHKYSFEEQWMKPLKTRYEVFEGDQSIYTRGDDGIMLWDKVGEDVKTSTDDIKHRRLNLLRESYSFMDPDSDVFSIDSTKERFLNGEKVYEVKMSNNINDEIDTYYYDTKEFMLKKYVNSTKYGEEETEYSNYRNVSGIQKAHHIEKKNMKSQRLEIRDIKQFKRNILMDKKIFEIPKEETDEYSFLSAM